MVAKDGRPPQTLTDLLAQLQQSTGMEAAIVNALYLKHRVWAAASVEYAEVGSPQLTRVDFCRAMVREGLCESLAVAQRFFSLFDAEDKGHVDPAAFVQGWARFHPSRPNSNR